MREIVFLLLLTAVVSAGLDQSYEHRVMADGESTIQKTMEMSLFSDEETLAKVEAVCSSNPSCDVDNKTITIRESLTPGQYYSFEDSYGLFIDYELTIKKIPTDVFSRNLDSILREAEVIDEDSSSAAATDLLADNSETAEFLRKFNVSITYTVEMPMDITEAGAGDVAGQIDGKKATFDIVEVMGNPGPIVVKSSQINSSYLIIGAGIIAFAALAVMYFRPGKKQSNKKRKKR